jgi:endonuclease/exonuclease/phosphatase family metal-dependent hydrolase
MKLLTWNIQWGRGADGRVDLERIVEHARRFAGDDIDVYCLQEVSDGYPELAGCDGSDQFARLAELLPGYVAIDGVATDTPRRTGPGRRRFGNMILSRLPVRQVFRHLLPWSPTNAAVMSMQRAAVEANLDAPFGPLRVTTTHLEYFAPAQRTAQVERLRELHREAVAQARCARPGSAGHGPFAHLPRAAAAVLTGDCNFRPESDDRARVLAAFDDGTPAYRDAWVQAHGSQRHDPTVGLYDKAQWPEFPFTFDFVFVSEDLAPRVQRLEVDPTSDASDHQPVLLELR